MKGYQDSRGEKSSGSQSSRKVRFWSAIIGSLALVLASCAAPPSAPPATSPPVQAAPTVAPAVAPAQVAPSPAPATRPARAVINERMLRSPTTWDIHRTPSIWDTGVSAKAYNQLLRWDPTTDEFGCDLCESWKWEGANNIVFTLRQGVKFHNGKDLAIRDVMYSMRKAVGEIDKQPSRSGAALAPELQGFETRDDKTFVIKLKRVSRTAIALLATDYFPIYPEGTTAEELRNGSNGSGPFVLAEHIPGSTAKFERNPNYFKKGYPRLDGITLYFIPDENAGVAALLAGRVDKKDDAGRPVSKEFTQRVNELVAQKKLVRIETPGVQFPTGLIFNVKKPPFDDVRVRKALALSIDRKALSAIATDGRGRDLLIYPAQEFNKWGMPVEWIRQQPGFRQPKNADVAEAKRLLAEAGFTPAKIRDTKLTLSGYGFTDEQSYLAQAVAGEVSKLGFSVSYEGINPGIYHGVMGALKQQMTHFGFGSVVEEPAVVLQKWTCGGPENWAGYCNPKYDALYQKIASTQDAAELRELAHQAEQMVVFEDWVIAPTVVRPFDFVWWSYVKGWKPPPSYFYGMSHEQMYRED